MPVPSRSNIIGALALIGVGLALPARADVVSDWAELEGSITVASYSAGASGQLTRSLFDPERHQAAAKVALAMFEAANATDPTYVSFLKLPRAPNGSSRTAAISTAAHDVLIKLYPAQAQQIEALHTLSMASVTDAETRERGIAAGQAVAVAALAAGGVDPALPLGTYRPSGVVGKWAPSTVPFAPEWVAIKPWFLKSASEYRGPPPVDLTSPQWAASFDEVKRLGAINSTERSAVDTIRANFWVGYDFYPAVRQVADRPGRTLVQNARLYALLAMVIDDVGIISSDGKAAHNFWRPFNAIRNADEDGNNTTQPDPTWLPLLKTPSQPEYPCAHCLNAVAIATVLDVESAAPADGYHFTSYTLPGITFTLPSLEKFAEQVMVSRIHGGVHFRATNEASAVLAKKFARSAMTRFAPLLRPPGK